MGIYGYLQVDQFSKRSSFYPVSLALLYFFVAAQTIVTFLRLYQGLESPIVNALNIQDTLLAQPIQFEEPGASIYFVWLKLK
jgi:hypothetical protein